MGPSTWCRRSGLFSQPILATPCVPPPFPAPSPLAASPAHNPQPPAPPAPPAPACRVAGAAATRHPKPPRSGGLVKPGVGDETRTSREGRSEPNSTVVNFHVTSPGPVFFKMCGVDSCIFYALRQQKAFHSHISLHFAKVSGTF